MAIIKGAFKVVVYPLIKEVLTRLVMMVQTLWKTVGYWFPILTLAAMISVAIQCLLASARSDHLPTNLSCSEKQTIGPDISVTQLVGLTTLLPQLLQWLQGFIGPLGVAWHNTWDFIGKVYNLLPWLISFVENDARGPEGVFLLLLCFAYWLVLSAALFAVFAFPAFFLVFAGILYLCWYMACCAGCILAFPVLAKLQLAHIDFAILCCIPSPSDPSGIAISITYPMAAVYGLKTCSDIASVVTAKEKPFQPFTIFGYMPSPAFLNGHKWLIFQRQDAYSDTMVFWQLLQMRAPLWLISVWFISTVISCAIAFLQFENKQCILVETIHCSLTSWRNSRKLQAVENSVQFVSSVYMFCTGLGHASEFQLYSLVSSFVGLCQFCMERIRAPSQNEGLSALQEDLI